MRNGDDDELLWVLMLLVVVTATVAAQNLAAGSDKRRKLTEVPPSFTERVLVTGQTDCGRLQQSDPEEGCLREGQHVTFRHLPRSMAAHLVPRCTPECYHSAVL